MQRVSGGYTIVEVMIFIGVSSVLILMSTTFLSGRTAHTQFSQSMRDVQSKMQSWFDSVSNGFAFGTSDSSSCVAGGSSVVINSTARSTSATPDCIFLGKAIQFADAPSTSIYAYSVFGKRVDSSGNLVGNLQSAGPVPAVASGGTGTADLTEIYTLKDGAQVKSITSSTSSDSTSHLAGFYLSLNTNIVTGQNGESDLKAYQYPVGNAAEKASSIIGCIENTGPPSACRLSGVQTDPAPLGSWKICFSNNANSDTALLTVNSSNGGFGVTTQLEFKAC